MIAKKPKNYRKLLICSVLATLFSSATVMAQTPDPRFMPPHPGAVPPMMGAHGYPGMYGDEMFMPGYRPDHFPGYGYGRPGFPPALGRDYYGPPQREAMPEWRPPHTGSVRTWQDVPANVRPERPAADMGMNRDAPLPERNMRGMDRPDISALLELSDKQREQMREIERQQRRAHWQHTGEMMEAREQLMDLYAKGERDPKVIGEAYEKIFTLRRAMIESRLQSLNEMEAMLEENQRERWQQLYRNRQTMDAMMGPMGR